MTAADVDAIESASALRRGFEVWYAAFGGVAAWTVHLVGVVAAEHWTATHPPWRWTLDALTAVTAAATIVAMALSWRLRKAASGADEEAADDAGQLLFLGTVGLLVGAINLALILLEGSYVHLITRS